MEQEPDGTDAPGGAPEAAPAPTARMPATARTLLLAAGLTLAVLAVAAVIVALGVGAREPEAGGAGEPGAGEPGAGDITVVETPVPLDERVPPTRQEPLPDLVLDGFDGGEPVDLASYRGRPLVVNLWATWCGPCLEEMPDVERVSRELDGRVAVLGVNVRDAPASAAALADDLGITYDLAADPEAELFQAIEAFGMPTTLLVTAEGGIVYRHTGLLDAGALRDLLREHLGVEVGGGGRWLAARRGPRVEFSLEDRVGQHREVSASDG